MWFHIDNHDLWGPPGAQPWNFFFFSFCVSCSHTVSLHIMQPSLSLIIAVCAGTLRPDRVWPFLRTERVVHRPGRAAQTEVRPSHLLTHARTHH